jgi:outer membrane protein assembly factor BamB
MHLGTQAAIKVLYIQLTSEGIEQFSREARTIARLEHPHIVHILDFGVESGTPFLIMSYAPNGTLRQRHLRGTQVPLKSVVSYVKQVASALQYAHEHHVIHRDIKPENLLVGRNDEILLSDFGIALVTQSAQSQHTQDLAGTIAYMAPEQIEGHPRPSSDQYALAIVIYEWLSGDQPFQGSFTEIAIKHIQVPPPPLREKVPMLSPAVEQVVLTALAKDPKQRFATIRAFATALEQASQITGHPPLAVQPSIVSPLPPKPIAPARLSIVPTELMTPPSQPIAVTTAPHPSVLPSDAVQASSAQPMLTPATEQAELTPRPAEPSRRGLSRRSVLMGLIGLVGVGAAGTGIAWLLRSPAPQTSSPPPSPTAPITSAVPHPTNYTVFGFDPQHTHFNSVEQTLSVTNVPHLVPYWKAPTGATITSSPAVFNGLVYIGSDDGKLYAFDAITGQQHWAALTGGRVYSSPAVDNGIVYVGSADSKLYAFDAITGNLRWSAHTGNQIYSSPTVVNGIVYVGSFDTKLYAFGATTGNLLWSTPTDSYIISSPAVASNVIYIGSGGGKLYALNATTGAHLWSTQVGDRIGSSPAVAAGVVYVGSTDHNLYALNATTGNILWHVSTGDSIYSSPAVAHGAIYIGSNDHYLYAFSTTGKQRWSVLTYSYVWSSPTVANGVVYVGSWDGKLYAVNATTGKVLWTGGASDHFFSSPTIVNGVVYGGSWDSKLYAFHLSSAKR